MKDKENQMVKFAKIVSYIAIGYAVALGVTLLFVTTKPAETTPLPDWSAAPLPVVTNEGEQGSTYNPQETIDGKELNR